MKRETEAAAHLRADDWTGAMYTAICLGATTIGLGLSAYGVFGTGPFGLRALLWTPGQVVLAFALLQWFVLLHECGHGVLFRRRLPNQGVGLLAGFFSTIPFHSWAAIHRMHHKWTGWQDLDPTTASLVPRPLGAGERWLMNFCWRYWVPVFSVLYRLGNFWNLPRLRGVLRARVFRTVGVNAAVQLVAYGGIVVLVGPLPLLGLLGPAVLLSLILLDPILLSQHSHMPMKNSGGQPVTAFPAHQQVVFTRSLRFPELFSRWVLLHFDAHEVHHLYPFVPGYRLREIVFEAPNEVHWWRWIRLARQMPADVLLFQNREATGSEV